MRILWTNRHKIIRRNRIADNYVLLKISLRGINRRYILVFYSNRSRQLRYTISCESIWLTKLKDSDSRKYWFITVRSTRRLPARLPPRILWMGIVGLMNFVVKISDSKFFNILLKLIRNLYRFIDIISNYRSFV